MYRTGQKATSRQHGHIYKGKLFIHLSQLTYVPCGKIKPSGSQREGDQDLWILKHSTLLWSPAFSLVNLRSKGLLLPNSVALWIKSSNTMCPWRIFNQHKQVHSPFTLYYLEYFTYMYQKKKNTKVGLKLMNREEVYVPIRNRNILVWGYSSVDKMLAIQA